MKVYRLGDKALCEFQGRLLYENLAGLNAELEELLGEGVRTLVLKLDHLLFLDSSALGMLLSLNAKALARSGRLSIIAPPANIMAMFASTRIDEVLEILSASEARAVTAELLGSGLSD